MSGLVRVLTIAAALGTGVVAGVWFAFSGFVMNGLERAPAPVGTAAMQSINRAAVRPPLMLALLGTAALCLGLVVWAASSWGERGAPLVLAGGLLYLLGSIVVTIAANVPRNDRLATLEPGSGGEAEAYWRSYASSWTAWNDVRAVTCVAACAALVVAVAR